MGRYTLPGEKLGRNFFLTRARVIKEEKALLVCLVDILQFPVPLAKRLQDRRIKMSRL